MKAVITIVGKDSVGILAKASTVCASYNANVIDVTQTVMGDIFSMVMLADIERLSCDFTMLAEEMKAEMKKMGLVAYVMHEDIFNAMHRI